MYNVGAGGLKGTALGSSEPYGPLSNSDDYAAMQAALPPAYPTPLYSSGTCSPRRNSRAPSMTGPQVLPPLNGDQSNNPLMLKKTTSSLTGGAVAIPLSPHLPPPLALPTNKDQASNVNNNSPKASSSSAKGHSRSRSSDAKDKDSQLARVRSGTDVPEHGAPPASPSSKKPKESKRSFFGLKKVSKDRDSNKEGNDMTMSSELDENVLMTGSGGMMTPMGGFASPARGPSPNSSPPVQNATQHPSGGGGDTLRNAHPAFFAALDSSFMRRSSYTTLVDKGIMREWNDEQISTPKGGTASPTVALSSGSYAAVSSPSAHGRTALVVPSVPDGGWHVERGSSEDFVQGAYNALEEDQNCSPYFKLYYNGKEHTNYWGVDSRIGPLLISVAATQPRSATSRTSIESVATFRASAQRLTGQRRMFGFTANDARNVVVHRCLVQSKFGSKQIFVRSSADKNNLFKGLALACAPMGYLPEIQDIKFKKVEIDITDDLMKMERSHFSSDYKFGVLYYKKGQTENEMFSNETSAELERFLDFLGDRVTLKGWTGFSGGLDVKTDTTGTQSVFTHFRELNIMFHVGTLLPFFPKDPQQLERKRHIGNDIVVIVYVEPGALFDPCMMKTQFNHIYAIISVDPNDQSVQLEFAVKQGVRPFGPQLPPGQKFYLDNNFREFFFTKLINSERAALKATVFAQKLEHTRKKLLESVVDRIQKAK